MAKKHPLYEVPSIGNMRDLMNNSLKNYGTKDAFLKPENKTYRHISYNEYKE